VEAGARLFGATLALTATSSVRSSTRVLGKILEQLKSSTGPALTTSRPTYATLHGTSHGRYVSLLSGAHRPRLEIMIDSREPSVRHASSHTPDAQAPCCCYYTSWATAYAML